MFRDWLLNQLNARNWSQAELARASNLTTAAISKYISGRVPDKNALKKIARGLDLPVSIVLEAAGILPPESPAAELIQQITHLVKDLPEEEQINILEYAKLRRTLAEQKRGQRNNAPASRRTIPTE